MQLVSLNGNEVIVEKSFWHQIWENNEIAFHRRQANPLLVKYFNKLNLAEGARVFLPLCGKTLDIAWLLDNGYRVVGAELSKLAIQQLFDELGVQPKISMLGEFEHYQAENLDILVGDIFELTDELLGDVDAVYDRAALVALPEHMRERYTTQIQRITHDQQQLLICYDYQQALLAGPPFAISQTEVQQHYRANYHITLLASIDVDGGLKGKCPALENVWLLQQQ